MSVSLALLLWIFSYNTTVWAQSSVSTPLPAAPKFKATSLPQNTSSAETSVETEDLSQTSDDSKSPTPLPRQLPDKETSASSTEKQTIAPESISSPSTIQKVAVADKRNFFTPPFHLEGTLLLYQDERSSSGATTTPYRISPSVTLPVDRSVDLHIRLSVYNGGAEQHTVGENQSGASIIDRAYLHFQWSSFWNLKVGHQFIPVGFFNLDQNPAHYYTATLPAIESALLMGPWHENGVLLHGGYKRLSYKIGTFNSLDAGADDASNYKAISFLNGGKQNGQNAKSKDLMFVGRADLVFDSGVIGASYVYGHTAQDGGLDTVDFALYEAHFRWSWKHLTLKGVYASGLLGEGESLPGDTVGTKASGHYLTLAYDLLPSSSHYSLPIFYQTSSYNLNEKVPKSRTIDPTLDKSYTSIGLNFSPKNQRYILKLNYTDNKNASSSASEQDADELQFSVGFSI